MKFKFAVAALALTCMPALQASAQSPEAFFRGKDIRILIGAGVGGTYGLYAQLAARHMRQYVPGQPNLVMQSMPGAGGNVALNFSYAAAPKDGTLIHLVHAEVLFETLLTKGVGFDASKYQYIGRIADADGLALATRASKLRTLDEARTREITMGATGINNVFALGPLMLNRLTGTRFKIIGGYKGTADIFIAMERGELDGAGMTLANVQTLHAEKLKSGALVPVFAIAAKRLAAFPALPAMTEFASGDVKTLLEIYASSGTIGRALAYPPGVPADRVAALREAFDKTMADPAFRAEAAKINAPVSPMRGSELAAEVERVMKAASANIEAARKLHEDIIRK